MGLLELLTMPVLGPPKLIQWIAEMAISEAERELLDEDRVRADLSDLQLQYDLGEIDEAEYDRREKVLIDRLNAIRELKAERLDQ